jgi:hypothetical protein
MDKKIAALLGAAAALTTVTAANAGTQTTGVDSAPTYRDLLNPVSDATAALKTDNARLAEEAAGGQVQLAQYYYHHHHHHHHFVPPPFRPFFHHHHHHHHHHVIIVR